MKNQYCEQKGFTLIELLVTVGISAVLAGLSLIVLNPFELLAQARDQRRLSDVGQIQLAVQTYVNTATAVDMDGPNFANSCQDQSTKRFFVSVPAGYGGTGPSLPPGWTLVQPTQTTMGQVGGSGWVPINFASSSGGSPIATLPVDPTNTFTDNFYYSYTCKTTGEFEITAFFESSKYSARGSDPRARNDGGSDPAMYEAGTLLSLDPLSPVGYWSLDEGSGTIAYDGSGNGGNGTIYSGTTTAATWTDGKRGKALTLDGNNDYVSIPHSSLLSPTSSVSLMLWINQSAFNGAPRNVSKWGASSGYDLWTTASGLPKLSINGSNEATGANALSASQWYHLAGTYDMANTKVYVDGSLAGSNPYAGAITTNTTTTTLGMRTDSTSFVNGIIDEVRIYNRALSATEVLRAYNAER